MGRSSWSGCALVLVDGRRECLPPEVAATAPQLPDRVAALLTTARAEGSPVAQAGHGDLHVTALATDRFVVDLVRSGELAARRAGSDHGRARMEPIPT